MVAGHLQIKKGHYYAVLNAKNQQGKRSSKWVPTGIRVGGKKEEKQAQEKLMEIRYSYKEPIIICNEDVRSRITPDMQFSDYMLSWLEIIKNSVEGDTYAGYEANVKKRIVPYFQKTGVKLGELTALDIERFYEYCFNRLKVKGSTVQHYHANIHKAVKYAIRHDLISSNILEKLDRPKSEAFVGSFYSIAEIETLFEAVKGDPVEFPVLMSAFYGLRRSEIMGLRWSAIDFEGNTLTVDHTVVQYRSDGKSVIEGKNRMKNKSSCRTMPLVPQYRELLLRMQERKAACKEFCGNCYTESEYIYVNELGIPYKPNFVSDHFKRVLKQHGLRPIRFHDLRHTCASLLLKNGVAMKDIQDWLGHSSYATTANIYAHLDTDSKKQPATKMNQAVSINPGISAAI
ncbi:tyrosine-type recombinase/integrase [Dysosmobacter sp.]|uniref:tyrosine-type recombinase/integrase n=1 Tax=Dysosmobacter sp. TaxID=2591382 RepID=UPI003AF01706